MDWYPWNPTRFKRKTYRLSLAEDGAYRRLIDEYMITGAPLPDDDRALARILGVSLEEWSVVAPNVRQFFRPREGVLRQKTCDEELATQCARKERFSARGKKAAFAKYSNPNYIRPSRMLVPATVQYIAKSSPSEYASEGSSEEEKKEAGDASPALLRTMQQKHWVR